MVAWRQVMGSSNVQAIAYDEEKQECYIRFFDPPGIMYIYSGVGPGMWNALIHAESKGSFIYQSLRGVHEFRKVPISED